MEVFCLVIKALPKGKAAGIDMVLNEYFIEYKNMFLPVLLKLFNTMLQIGYFPESWAQGVIIPLHKKGNINNVNNYRGITLISHLAKLFTSLLNKRLLK